MTLLIIMNQEEVY